MRRVTDPGRKNLSRSATCIAAAKLMQSNGMELKSVIMLELDNLETLLQEKDIQANFFCCLQHLQLRFETEDKARRLLSNVSFLLKPGGYFFGITPEKVIGKNRCF
ncbi:hypothetical protein ERO13_D07G155000v2 [Gossypium hirsutum]|uniref:mRNA (guanine-N(7))-methyltransferase n=1 Tax=Gossypium darwinii TaxID=34276 RepID=A0A5D2BX07_GOSDA|nr:hypothetical protein ERO13_D07G155000v2 [Gossypium hirsutum]TYG61807.1 hypothetical protein ES288_D07G178700v1 [Gossypium darwinii]